MEKRLDSGENGDKIRKNMNVLSLFDGISCGQIALNRAGIKYDKYFASEIDKKAIQVTQSNYPDTIQLGSVLDVKSENLPKIDLIIAGSPCQGFSFAGKQLNFNDSRSKLFFEFVRLLEELKIKNPNIKFLLENVRMKKEYLDTISKYLGVEPIKINSALVSAQNRVRYYWTNIPNVAQPNDLKISLKDIIQEDYDGIYVIPRGGNKGGVQKYKGKSPSITISSWEHNLFIARYSRKTGVIFPEKIEKSLSICASDWRGINRNQQQNCVCKTENGDILIRPFSPEECEKLQTVPIGYTSTSSKSQRIKQLGNGWTVDVIVHIFKNLDFKEI